MMAVGGIIGAGIFLNPAIVAQRVGSWQLTLAAWAIGGIIALFGGLCFAELGGRAPRAGGGYVYLRDAFGPLPAFLYGWALLLVINSGALAAVASIAAAYTLALFGTDAPLALPLALAFVWCFTLVNVLGIRPGAVAQNVFTVSKLAALGLVIGCGLLVAPGPKEALAAAVPATPWQTVVALGAALIPVMFATGGWQNANFIGGEIRDPGRNLPRAIVLGVAIVVTVYLLANIAYLRVLGAAGLAGAPAPASAVAEAALGSAGALAINVGVVISTLGILNLFILAAPRVYQTMAEDGLFFRTASRLHPRYRTPVGALLFQGAWTSVLAITGSYGQLLDYVVFGDWIFFALVASTLFVYRRRDRPDDVVAFRTPALGVVAGTFIAAAAAIVLSSVVSNPGNAALGAVLILAGIPVYMLWRARS